MGTLGLLKRAVSGGTGILPVRPRAILALETKDLHGQDGRATHGQDAHATFFNSPSVPVFLDFLEHVRREVCEQPKPLWDA